MARRNQGAGRMPSHCESCGRIIKWCVTQAGERMPVDDEPHEHGNIVIEPPKVPGGNPIAIVTQRRVPGQEGLFTDSITDETRPRYRSHFATCPNAAEHRR